MPTRAAPRLVTLDDIRAAARRIEGVALRSPLLRLDERTFVKAESLQPTGAFKLRGAYNAMVQLDERQKRAGVVTHSSGNHAQAVAYVARLLGLRAVIVMPENAVQLKVRRVRAWGAQVVFVSPSHEERSRRAAELAASDGLALIPSANDEAVIAGQGTIGLEIIEQLSDELGELPERLSVLVPVGQGGLAAGVGTAVKSLDSRARVFGVEPELAADARDSLAAGEIVRWSSDAVQRTVADGLRMEAVAPLAFGHLRRYLDGVLTVSEQEIRQAVGQAVEEARLVVEPSGAVSLAALLAQRSELEGVLVAVISGGNVDMAAYALLLRGYHRA